MLTPQQLRDYVKLFYFFHGRNPTQEEFRRYAGLPAQPAQAARPSRLLRLYRSKDRPRAASTSRAGSQ